MRLVIDVLIAGVLASSIVAMPARVAAGEKKESTQLLVAFGASVGGMLFESHDKISACELALAKDAANTKEIVSKLSITTNILKILIENLEKARDDKVLNEADRTFVAKSVDAARLVQEEANALKAYASTRDVKDLARYQESRVKADKEIKLVLGIKN